MNRITPEQVVAAYKATGFQPIRRTFLRRRGDEVCVCGLSACAIVNGIHWLDLEERIESSTPFVVWLATAMNVSEDYAWGFVHGFDGASRQERSEDGYADGRAAAAPPNPPRSRHRHAGQAALTEEPMNLTHATYICRDQHDSDTLHVYTKTLVDGKPNGNIYHDYALKIDELDSYWGESGRTLQRECRDPEAFTTLTAIVLSCEVVKRERASWDGVR